MSKCEVEVKKNIFLDTSVMIDDPDFLDKFGKHDIYVSPIVIQELNELKDDKRSFLRSKAANDALKSILNKMDNHFDQIKTGIPLGEGLGSLFLEDHNGDVEHIEKIYGEADEDNLILSLVKHYQENDKESENPYLLVSNDIGMIVKAQTLGIKAETYMNSELLDSLEDIHIGYREVDVSQEVLDEFKENGKVPLWKVENPEDAIINEFLWMRTMFQESYLMGRIVIEDGEKVVRKLLVSTNREYMGIKPEGAHQIMAMDLLLDPNVPFVTLLGKAGTGKTMLALVTGLLGIEENKYKRIFALRSEVSVDGKEKPALPGELNAKLKPYMEPYYDNLEFIYHESGKDLMAEEIMEELERKLEVNSTAYMRGRTLPYQLVIVDEAQNLTRHEVKTILTRIGKHAKVVFLGDPTQVDARFLNELNNGLVYAAETMKHSKNSGTVYLKGKGKRSDLAEEVAELMRA